MKIRYFKALETFESEGRIFKEGEIYPAEYKNESVVFIAENGQFMFTERLFEKLVIAWDDSIVEVQDEENI
ncbi:hypothetical protein DXP70_08150 [Listeria monocytogenes]|nr:hypothetical protein [Listeria monocytogenes]MDB03031.1 hypothetical protein [Listeria monocytogenes]MDB35375.1 hypothetical protein [Listeria monocytogenes]